MYWVEGQVESCEISRVVSAWSVLCSLGLVRVCWLVQILGLLVTSTAKCVLICTLATAPHTF